MSLRLASAIPRLPKPHSDTRIWAVAQLLAPDPGTNRLQVSIRGGPPVWLPYVNGVYTSITTVYVLLDPAGSGAGQLVIGPAGNQGASTPPPPPANVPVTKTYKTTISPSDSGTWSTKWGRFYAWNVGRYGGSTTCYQSSGFGSQQLYGIAVYGNQIKALGADAITSAVLSVPLATGSGTVQVQESAMGSLSSLPTTFGSTASGTGTIALGSTIRDDLRTGAAKGLVLVGAAYLAVYGKGHAPGMSLAITYTKTT